MTPRILLQVRDVSKTFPGLNALDNVSLTVSAGEILALVGQNGSGKSTLVKVLAGVHEPDPGSQISLGGNDGSSASMHFIHQDLALVGSLSTIENLDLTRELGGRALRPSPIKEEAARARDLVADFGGAFDVRVPIDRLTAAERTIVAIARALEGWDHPHNVLVLDEPTASLHGDEAQKLFSAVRRVAERGAGVIFVSHRLEEVVALADRVVCLRDGKLIADAERGTFDQDDLVKLIAGQTASTEAPVDSRHAGHPVLVARRIRAATIRSMDLVVRAGEIVGVSGVIGSGREELAGALFGASPGAIGSLEIDRAPTRTVDPPRTIAAGIGYVPGDRHRHGAVMTMSARENMTLPRLSPLRRAYGRLDLSAEKREVAKWFSTVSVRPAEPERRLELFSGGNQQKVVLAKWLRNDPKVLLLDEPTQGVDVGAKVGIYELITNAAAAGAGVLVCSSDEKELAHMCDRVLVMRDGEVVAEMARPALTEAALVLAGLGPAEAANRGPTATT